MSSESMDPNPETLEHDSPSRVQAGADAAAVARDWPGVSREHEPAPIKFPGENGGKSLASMAERDLMAAVQLLAERAQYITGATGAAIALRDGDEMVCRASAGGSAPEIGARLQMDSGLSGESIRTRQLLRCNDAQTDGRVNRESCEALGIASVVVMPMLDGGEVIGVFELFSDRAYAFEDRDIVALERMGAMVRTALEQAEGVTAVEDNPIAQEPVLAERSAEQGPEGAEELRSPFVAGVQKATPEVVETAPQAGNLDAQDEDAAPIVEQGKESLNELPFLSVPGNSIQKNEYVAPKLVEEKVEAAEPDVGELARDAAAKTEAWKASLFASETPSETEVPLASETRGRIAFHTRLPRKIESVPAAAATPAAPANVARASDKKKQWETPVLQSESEDPIATTFGGESTTSEQSTPNSMLSQPKAEESKGPGKMAEPAVNRVLPRASASTAAAAAPALEASTITVDPLAKAEEKTASISPAPLTAVVAGEEAPKPKAEVARPASPEGRARIAVAQVRKCEACGFPVSEGRKLCLDCEKKPHNAETTAKPTTAAEVPVAPSTKSDRAVIASVPPVHATVTGEAPVAASKERPAMDKSAETAEKAEHKSEIKKSEVAPAVHAVVPEPLAPQFMLTTPDHNESWIVSHMYSAVAIAVVLVGIVVLLVLR